MIILSASYYLFITCISLAMPIILMKGFTCMLTAVNAVLTVLVVIKEKTA